MANYSDGPSMDEILERIKRALADREHRAEGADYAQPSGEPQSLKEYARSREVTEKILEELTGGGIFVKPAQADMEAVRLSREDEIRPAPRRDEDVFVLTKSRKIPKKIGFADADVELLCENLAIGLARDLGIPYLVPKIEAWFRSSLPAIVEKSKK
jgi:hypothetical protein